MTIEPRADVRDMHMAHTVFRREFGLAADLVRSVKPGDAESVKVVSEHIELVGTMLHHHHEGEDVHLWPRLVDRGGAAAAAAVRVMDEQHEAIGKCLSDVRTSLLEWRTGTDPRQGDELAAALERLLPVLTEHLGVEEDLALPLIEKHITAAEWGQMLTRSGAGTPPDKMPLIFGMMAYEAPPETVAEVIEKMPAEIREVIGGMAAQAFARYAERVHGTPTPERIGARL
ncbi:hemerythrin domain-containing protein [Streptomyces shenzhenensis]|uniref:hemerythrin domain-containing protein n=1 Tax=Streptomyces shenzhenensis TaxID=943815 RepID=UPI0033EF5C96